MVNRAYLAFFYYRIEAIHEDIVDSEEPKFEVEIDNCEECRLLEQKVSAYSDSWKESFQELETHVNQCHDICDFVEVIMLHGTFIIETFRNCYL